MVCVFFFFKQKTAYEMRISDWSSDVCSSDLPFSVSAPAPRPGLENEMLELINADRAKADLAPMQPDEGLRQVARRHSADMFARSYFSHISPEGDTPFDRIRRANITFLTAGENLAIAQTLPLAHEGLRSEEHTSELQSLMRISYAVFCLNTK